MWFSWSFFIETSGNFVFEQIVHLLGKIDIWGSESQVVCLPEK